MGYKSEWIKGERVQADGEVRAGSFLAGIELLSTKSVEDGEIRCYSVVVTNANNCNNFAKSIKEHFRADVRQTTPSTFYVEVTDCVNW